MAKITIYGTPVSVYVRIVRLLLEEVGAEYDLKSVDIFNGESQSPDYLAKNPFGKVPTVEIDGESIYETAAIIGYLDTIVADNKFSPADPLQLARMRQIMGIVDNYLYAPAIGTLTIQRLIVPSQGGTPDEATVKDAIPLIQKALKAIELLTVGRPYLLGNQLTIADFYLIFIFTYISQTPEFESIIAESPKLKAWWDQASQLPNVKKVTA